MLRRIKRDYRQMGSPAKFLVFCKKVKHAVTDNPHFPDWMGSLRQQFFGKVDSLDTTHHLALDGSRSQIRERDKIIQELIVLLDQIASGLESALMLNPDALFTMGFTLTQERRSSNRAKAPLGAPVDFNVTNTGERGKAFATVSPSPGVVITEIQFNLKDPSLETDWVHKANFLDPQDMVMAGLEPGNTFFRMRHYGEGEVGPWSAIVSASIS